MANGRVYRRGSVFGALLLIAIGALFLYANLTPSFNPWPVVARYWPVLIIFWGLSRLVDYLMLRGTPQAAAVTRLGAGDIIGLIFIIIFGTLLTRAVQSGFWHGPGLVIDGEEVGCLFGTRYEFSEEVKQAVTAPTALTLDDLRGDLTATGEPGDEIRVAATKIVCATSQSQAQEVANRFTPVLEQNGDGYTFHWATSGSTGGFLSADVDLHVPQTTALTVTGQRGDVNISNLGGELAVTMAHGDAQVRNVDGNVHLQVRGGDVHVEKVQGAVEVEGRGDEVSLRNVSGAATLKGEFYGPIEFASIAGPARFNSRRTDFSAASVTGKMIIDGDSMNLRDVPGDVTLLTRDREINLEGVAGAVHIENRNGHVSVRAPSPLHPIQVQNRNGDIELYLPANASFQISASARRGDVSTDFSGLTTTGDRADHALTGIHGGGQVAISVSTDHGDILVRRSG